MTAKEALHLYKSRDVSEKLLPLINHSLETRACVHIQTKELREGFYTIHRTDNPKQNLYCITGRERKLEKKQNYMTVPAAIRELEKIEMTRQTDNVYRLDHAVTAKQKKS